jgi:hypothetical protein
MNVVGLLDYLNYYNHVLIFMLLDACFLMGWMPMGLLYMYGGCWQGIDHTRVLLRLPTKGTV